jgi:hypothetical protein
MEYFDIYQSVALQGSMVAAVSNWVLAGGPDDIVQRNDPKAGVAKLLSKITLAGLLGYPAGILADNVEMFSQGYWKLVAVASIVGTIMLQPRVVFKEAQYIRAPIRQVLDKLPF